MPGPVLEPGLVSDPARDSDLSRFWSISLTSFFRAFCAARFRSLPVIRFLDRPTVEIPVMAELRVPMVRAESGRAVDAEVIQLFGKEKEIRIGKKERKK